MGVGGVSGYKSVLDVVPEFVVLGAVDDGDALQLLDTL